MKRCLSLLAFLLVSFTFVAAQGYPWNNNNNSGYNGQGGPQTNWNSNNPWANFNLPLWLQTWLNNGGQIPPLLAADVIFEARAWGQQNFNLSYLQMLAKYSQGSLTIEYIPASPPPPAGTTPVVLTFRVRYGIGEILILDSF